jgi:hypothetical protein
MKGKREDKLQRSQECEFTGRSAMQASVSVSAFEERERK